MCARRRGTQRHNSIVNASTKQAHSAPLQILFYEGNDFPAAYKGSGFRNLTRFLEPCARTSYKVVRLLFDNTGKPTGEHEDFIIGFVISGQAGLGSSGRHRGRAGMDCFSWPKTAAERSDPHASCSLDRPLRKNPKN
jgi:glucose/arabinose dehydrogenase